MNAAVVLLALGCGAPPPPPSPPAPAPADAARPGGAGVPAASSRTPGPPLLPTGLPAPPERWQCRDTPELECFVQVPGATFWMGAQATDAAAPGHDPDARPDEGPPRLVTVASFWVLKHEATANGFARCIEAGWCRRDQVMPDAPLSTLGNPDRAFHPINGVTWDGARAWCGWMGGRLPTEAEWELAARGTDGRRFPWGNEAACATAASRTAGAWSREMDAPPCVHQGTLVVSDERGPSPQGLMGLAGNALEWVADWYGPYAPGPATDPTGPPSGTLRALRGGSWVDEDPRALRAAARSALPADSRLPDVGFRCVYPSAP